MSHLTSVFKKTQSSQGEVACLTNLCFGEGKMDLIPVC